MNVFCSFLYEGLEKLELRSLIYNFMIYFEFRIEDLEFYIFFIDDIDVEDDVFIKCNFSFLFFFNKNNNVVDSGIYFIIEMNKFVIFLFLGSLLYSLEILF